VRRFPPMIWRARSASTKYPPRATSNQFQGRAKMLSFISKLPGQEAIGTSTGSIAGVNRHSGLAIEITLTGYLLFLAVTR